MGTQIKATTHWVTYQSVNGGTSFYCHMTADSDMGMMQAIGIVEQGEDLTANVTADGIYPWACQENNPIGLPLEKETTSDTSASNPWLLIAAALVMFFLFAFGLSFFFM